MDLPPVVKIWTDGSIDKNPGTIGGWAFLIRLPDGQEIRRSGAYKLEGVTNNHSEITAAIMGLDTLARLYHDGICDAVMVLIVSDSKYVINQGEKNWKRNKNIELLDDFDEAIAKCTKLAKIYHALQHPPVAVIAPNIVPKVCFSWVRGHAGVEENEIVDKLAGIEVTLMANNG